MHLEEFAEGKSFFHLLDPRVKFLAVIPYLFLLAIIPGWPAPLAALIFALWWVLWARLDAKRLLNRLAFVNIFVLLISLFLLLSRGGEQLPLLGLFSVSRPGFFQALAIALKTNAIVLTTIVILGTTEVFSLAHALVHLKFPPKLVQLFFFFYRYISVLHEEYTRLRNAMKIRCFQAGTNLHSYRSLAFLVGMLIVRSSDRSERIYHAMLCRGFRNEFHVVRHFHLHRQDYYFSLIMFFSSIIIGLVGFGALLK